MKNIQLIILQFIAIAIFTACDKKLDLQPYQSVEADKILTTSDGIINLLHGAYSGIKGTYGTNEGGELYGGHFNFMSEELADDGDASFIGTFQEHRDFFEKTMTTDHKYVLASWIRAYDVINMVNIVLDKLNIVDESERQRVEGEALCIRGMLYFEMARFWGAQWDPAGTNSQPGVPIRLTPTYSIADATFIPRSTVAQVYARAISDLTNAETLLEPYGNNDVGVNTYTASAYLSRIYLQQSRFEEAALAVDRIISSKVFSLVDEPIKEFN
jgi:starch-binding outer membrane protein, SusD/RagB family